MTPESPAPDDVSYADTTHRDTHETGMAVRKAVTERVIGGVSGEAGESA
ncbi:hypothetical protein ACGFNV_34905 [Streptomyces sp. NPDC048751]